MSMFSYNMTSKTIIIIQTIMYTINISKFEVNDNNNKNPKWKVSNSIKCKLIMKIIIRKTIENSVKKSNKQKGIKVLKIRPGVWGQDLLEYNTKSEIE